MMTELVSLAIGAIGALIGFAGLLLLGGVVFAVALAVKNLPLGLRAALSAFATYCFAASLLGNHALESMDILMVRTMFNFSGLVGVSGICLTFIELISAGSPRRTLAGRAIMRGGRMRVRSAGRVHAASGMSPVFSEPRHLSPVMLS